jgi:hypothetical protein
VHPTDLRCPSRIAPTLARLTMHTTVELDYQALLGTAKVSNLGSHGMLAAKPEPT